MSGQPFFEESGSTHSRIELVGGKANCAIQTDSGVIALKDFESQFAATAFTRLRLGGIKEVTTNSGAASIRFDRNIVNIEQRHRLEGRHAQEGVDQPDRTIAFEGEQPDVMGLLGKKTGQAGLDCVGEAVAAAARVARVAVEHGQQCPGMPVIERIDVRMVAGPAASLSIAPGVTRLVAGQRLHLTATSTSKSGDPRADVASWRSSAPAVATVLAVHASQKMRAQMRQWWRRLMRVKVALHRWHCG